MEGHVSHQTDLTLMGGLLFNFTPPTPVAGAGVTLTPAQLLSGMIDRTMGGSKTDILPTAADLYAAMSRGGYAPPVGVSFDCAFRNLAAATDVLTLTLGAGMTASPGSTLTVAAASTRAMRFVVSGPGTITVYSMGVMTY
jgi:hypothetical protein